MKKIISSLGIATVLTLGLNCSNVLAQDIQQIESWVKQCDWSNGEAALDACDQLLKVDPTFSKAKIEKGLVFFYLDKYAEAQKIFDQILDKPIDLILLANSFDKFINSKGYQTESELKIHAEPKNSNDENDIEANLKVKTIAKLPNLFWSEITFQTLDANYQPKINIISDGKNVWKIDSNSNQYVATNFETFSQELDSLVLFSSYIYLLFWQGFYSEGQISTDIPPEQLQKLIKVGIIKMVMETLLYKDVSFTGSLQQQDYVYEYFDKNAPQGLKFKVFVDPKTAVVKKIELTGQEESLNMIISEQIQSRIANPSIENNLFEFKPNSGAKKVDSLSIWDLFVKP